MGNKSAKDKPFQIDAKLYLDAEKGLLSRHRVLVDSAEISRLEKSGLEIQNKEPAIEYNSRDLFYVTISWATAFSSNKLPENVLVFVYTPSEGPCPSGLNYAQYLYVKALRFATLARSKHNH